MPRSLAARWAAWERRAGRGIAPTSLSSPLSPITFPGTKLRGLVEIAPGADLSADPSTWSWVDITQWVRKDLGISTVFGRRDQAGLVDPSRATLKLDNRDGRFSRRNPTGPYYGQLTRTTPIRIAVDPGDGMHYRYHGFVNQWPKRWDRSGRNSTVTITCGGILRRLQRSKPLRSALFRSMAGVAPDGYVPHAYWPMEDGSDATQFASGVVDGPKGNMAGTVSLASHDTVAGSAPLPTFSSGAAAHFYVPGYDNADQFWLTQFVLNVPSFSATTLGTWRTPGGTAVRWTLSLVAGATDTLELNAYNGAGGAELTASVQVSLLGDSGFYGYNHMISVGSYFSGSDVWCHLEIQRQGDGTGSSIATSNIIIGGTHAPLRNWTLSSSIDQVVYGHAAVYLDPIIDLFGSDSPNDINAAAMDGWAGEQAHERIKRICREEGVSVYCVAGESAACGPQPVGTLLEILRDAEKADLGVLYEREFGLGYQALSERYGQPVQLALDVEAGHIGEPPEADDSDLRFRNQWTVKRTNGSERTVLSEDYDDTEGLYPGSTTVNVHTDDQLQHVAGWLVHRDTADEDYWTGLTLRFSRAPDMIPAWVSLPFGARMTVANPPSQADPGDIDAIVEGWSERWDQVSWQATLNTSPASTLEVPVWDDLGFLWDSGSSSLTSDITDSATSISVTTTEALDLWVEGAVDFDIEVGGEQMTVTNISGATSPQTFTVTRAVNGITKSHSAGDRVALWTPPIWGL